MFGQHLYATHRIERILSHQHTETASKGAEKNDRGDTDKLLDLPAYRNKFHLQSWIALIATVLETWLLPKKLLPIQPDEYDS
jgi:hypothetical protein